ncbi:MAG TPA: CHAD domain-containing protein [Conexibacter sp.]|nr:CHAD domain-containing protein [Conexibacter sp.]
MAYRLSIADDLPTSVRACAREQLEGAVRQLERADEHPVDAVHEARKHLKKARALLRLVRPALGAKAYRRENDALREAGLALSGTRDADVRVETAAKLAERFAGQLPSATFAQLREALAGEAAGGRGDGGTSDLAAVLEALGAAAARVEQWPLGSADWDDVLAGVARAYTRGRKAFAAARREPTAERLHDWRKRAKDLWYHERLLTPAWPGVLAAQAEQAHELTELLGDDHDLAVLAERLRAPTPLPPAVEAERDALLALVAERSTELRAAATRLGRRVYAESPKAFSRRLARYVHTAVEERRASAPPEAGGPAG